MSPAGLTGLYGRLPASPSTRNITYRDLHNHDIKLIVSVLRDYPVNPESKLSYWTNTKDSIKDLPSHLRSSTLSRLSNSQTKDGKAKDGKLCAGHAGLNAALIHSLWDSIRSDIDCRVGAFLYPIIMFARLPEPQELRLRQMEPVSQMWRSEFNIIDHTLPGREPLLPTERLEGGRKVAKWRHQSNGCAACMLARLGSDSDVLFALMTSMVGCYSSRAVGKKSSDIKSKRVRFVRDWLKKFGSDGEKLAQEAWDLGKELRRLRKEWKEHERRSSAGPGFYGRSAMMMGMGEGPPVSRMPFNDGVFDDRSSTRTLPPLLTPTRYDRVLRTGDTAKDVQVETGRHISRTRSSSTPTQPGLLFRNAPGQQPQYRNPSLNPSVHSETASVASESISSLGTRVERTSFGLNLPRPPLGRSSQTSRPGNQGHPDGLRGMYRAHAPAPLNLRGRAGSQPRQTQPAVSRNSIYAGFQVDDPAYDRDPETPLESQTPVVPAGPLGGGDESGDRLETRTIWSDMY